MNLKKQFGYPAKRGPFSAGFTLIELLVVVLIIGILSSVALPQYTKAVEKSRAATVIPLVRAVRDAQDRYYMANSTYSEDGTDLDIEYTCPNKFYCTFYPTASFGIRYTPSGWEIRGGYAVRNADSGVSELQSKIYCSALTGSEAEKFCKTFSSTPLNYNSDGYTRYEIK
ncbi:MAG: prepilin-type N-terminal cleavage/methylation domain-containing protein [Elusimicrobiaceae bacterium]|nr:prepilin-type N-terminal cleavage/methylation domain-containing protein [Elusimicrobiaceae bacterium]